MFQSAALWVAIKRLDLDLGLDRWVFFLITSVHFPGNAGMFPYTDSFQVERTQDPVQKAETAKAKCSGEVGEKTTTQRTVPD